MADKWISIDESERQRSGEAPSSDRVAERERERERQAKREALLKARMLEARIADTVSRTRDREAKRIDRELAERIAELEAIDRDTLEAIHGSFTQFFIVGSGLVFAFCIGGIALFIVVMIIGILGSLINMI